MNLGQENTPSARIAAEMIASEFCVSHKELLLPDFSLPELDPSSQRKIFPYQTTLLATIGANYAKQLNVDSVVLGTDSESHSMTYDKKLAATFAEGLAYSYTVIPVFPIKTLSRQQRIELVKQHPLGFVTVSCWKPTKCGSCDRCNERIALGLDL